MGWVILDDPLPENWYKHAEKREAVVHVDKPWADVTIQRKLPPLKYYYDFEMSMSSSCCFLPAVVCVLCGILNVLC